MKESPILAKGKAYALIKYNPKENVDEVDIKSKLQEITPKIGYVPSELELKLAKGVRNLTTDDPQLINEFKDAEEHGITHGIEATLVGAKNEDVAGHLNLIMMYLSQELYHLSEGKPGGKGKDGDFYTEPVTVYIMYQDNNECVYLDNFVN
jgi:hypothetical protein